MFDSCSAIACVSLEVKTQGSVLEDWRIVTISAVYLKSPHANNRQFHY